MLSDYFEQVTVLERDEIDDRPIPHKSVPQAIICTRLLKSGQRVLTTLYPSFTDDLEERGAHRIAIGRNVA